MAARPATPALKGAKGRVTPDLYSAFVTAVSLGEIRPGERLSEERLGALWNVSRVPVREALLRLEHEGLVIRRRNSGTYVRQVDEEEIAEIYDVRIRIEPMVAERAALAATDGEITQLLQLARTADLLGVDPHQGEARDRAFHAQLCEVSRLRHATRILHLARLHLRCSTLAQRISMLGTFTVSQPGHQPIAAAVKAHDAHRAGEAMAEHLRAAKKATLQDFQKIRAKLETARAQLTGS
jgi:DNA-binding GntR family transcriptional regulator